MSSRKPTGKYPQEARDRAVELVAADNTYADVRKQLHEEFPKVFKTKSSPSDGWISKCLDEAELEEEDKSLASSESPSLNKVLGEYIRKATANRIAQSFEMTRQQPNDLVQLMNIEGVAIRKQQGIIIRIYGQETLETLFGKGSPTSAIKPISTEPKIDEEFDQILRKDLQMAKTRLYKRQIEKLDGDGQQGDSSTAQLTQLMMLEKMTKEDKRSTTKDIIDIVEAVKTGKDEHNAGIDVLLETIKMNREQTNLQEQFRIKERDLQYQRELQMRESLDNERSDALRREIALLQEKQSQATQTPEQMAERMMYWEKILGTLKPKQSTGDWHKDIEIRKLDIQDKAVDTTVRVIDARLAVIERSLDKGFNTWLGMVERQQERNLEAQGLGTPHPRSSGLPKQTPLAPPPRSDEERELAYEQVIDDAKKIEELRTIRENLSRKAGGI